MDDHHFGYVNKIIKTHNTNYRRMHNILKLSYLDYSQTGLNLLLDDHHFGYVNKIIKTHNTNRECIILKVTTGHSIGCYF
jgi:hypothetical protein